MQGFIRRYHEQHTSNKIQLMLQRMNNNAYNANLGLDDYFFFQIPTKLGEGTTKTNYPWVVCGVTDLTERTCSCVLYKHFNKSVLIFVCHNKFFVCVIT